MSLQYSKHFAWSGKISGRAKLSQRYSSLFTMLNKKFYAYGVKLIMVGSHTFSILTLSDYYKPIQRPTLSIPPITGSFFRYAGKMNYPGRAIGVPIVRVPFMPEGEILLAYDERFGNEDVIERYIRIELRDYL